MTQANGFVLRSFRKILPYVTFDVYYASKIYDNRDLQHILSSAKRAVLLE